jgi:pimeloyl-ACP methyl ester carboxylesterase
MAQTAITYFERPHGRRIALHRLVEGDSGKTIVICHAAPGSAAFDPDPEQTWRRGVTLLAVDRPGYGQSDPVAADEWSTVGAAADDLAAALDQLGLSGIGVAGWSAGGRVALALAARRPDLVDGIVTLGSPLLAPGAAHQLLLWDLNLIVKLQRAGLGSMMGSDCTSGECAKESWEAGQAPLDREVAFTSVFSRRDGIVDWRACLDPLAKTVEVRTSHLGMAFDPVVLDIVGSTLAANRARTSGSAAVSARATLAAAPAASAG